MSLIRSNDPVYVVWLRPVPAGADAFGRDPAYRLRRALKLLGRGLGLKALRVECVPVAPRMLAGGRKMTAPGPPGSTHGDWAVGSVHQNQPDGCGGP